MAPLSPLAPAAFPDLPDIAGLSVAAGAAGVRYPGRTDVMLALLEPGARVAGVFTRSSTRSAPVRDCEAKIAGEGDGPTAILVNSGNSNAFTGRGGEEAVARICAGVAKATGAGEARVFTASTGVIGEPLPDGRITAVVADLAADLAPGGLERAARAIMTTDTFPKGSARVIDMDGREVRIAGIAKGSGMVAPDMGTMLVYIFTDAEVDRPLLQEMLSELTEVTFNRITVDGDTSTSDTLMLAATARSARVDRRGGPFEAALHEVMLDLAHQVVRDGEGATKFVEVAVTGAETEADARLVAGAIANSPLVKTAIAGQDPNWGRVVMAVGKSGAAADRDRLTIRFGDILVAENGWVAPGYREEDGAAYMEGSELTIGVDLGLGNGTATMWTCDLTHGYIQINADYRS